jgi:dipeptidyl-peptidase-4
MACRSTLFGLVFVSIGFAQAEKPDASKLSVDRIFSGQEFQAERVPGVKWLGAGAYATLEADPKLKGKHNLVRTDSAGKKEVLIPAEKLRPENAKEPIDIQGYELSKDSDLALIYTNSVRVWRQNTRGDYWIFRRSTGELRKLGGDAKPSTLMFAKLSPDGKNIGYVCDNNLYIQPVDSGTPKKLTTDGTANVINGTFDWVYEEEFDCRDGWRWSHDGKFIAYWQLDTHGVPSFTMIDNTAANYPVLKTFAYPKTGETNSACRVGVIPAAGGETQWIKVPGDTRKDCYIPRMEWMEGGEELSILRINRLQNALDVMVANPANGNVRTVLTERDAAWVDVHDDTVQWIEKGDSLLWLSERDGWRQLHTADRDGKNIRKVTKGAFDVIRVLHVDPKGEFVDFAASPENPTQQYLFRVPLKNHGEPKRLTPANEPGWHDYNVSPCGAFAIHTYSTFGVPPRIELISLPDHTVVRVLASNQKLRDALAKLKQPTTEFFRTDVGNGVRLDGWMIKPPDFDPAKKYPLFFYVYGEPAGQNVTDRWGGSRYLWHLMLAQQGYVVACVDNRGTPCPKGREWRKVVYRQIGTLASKEQAAAARELLKRPYLDATRVGVWGWSGGGSMTLNLLFREPDLYRTGMSVAPVPDMRLYDTIYQERYMGLPQDNAADYKSGSPITHAKGLKGHLLLVHGTGDDNCHYQGTEKLVDKLIELNKPFSMLAYPNRSHSVNEGKNTTRHLYASLTRFLNDTLPAGPKP